MKRLFIFTAAILSACTYKSPTPQQMQYPSDIRFNVKAGHYEQLRVLTWEPNDPICATMTLLEPHLGTKWGALAGISIVGKDGKDLMSIRLVSTNNTSKELSLTYIFYQDTKKDEGVLVTGLNYNEKVNLELSFPAEKKLILSINGNKRDFELPFEPAFIDTSTSSAKSKIEINTDKCL